MTIYVYGYEREFLMRYRDVPPEAFVYARQWHGKDLWKLL